MNTKSKGIKKSTIGFIGQGFIGKHMANDFERRGFSIVRYAKETPYNTEENRLALKECDIVFIAVPTPTTPKGFDYSIVESTLSLVGRDNIAVIKSTILPGTVDMLQKKSLQLLRIQNNLKTACVCQLV